MRKLSVTETRAVVEASCEWEKGRLLRAFPTSVPGSGPLDVIIDTAGIYKIERALDKVRAALVQEACDDEIERFNAALEAVELRVEAPGSLAHGRTLLRMGWDFVARFEGQVSFHYCNDSRWAALLKQAGVERHPLFK